MLKIEELLTNKLMSQFSNMNWDKEGNQYHACKFDINNKKILFRSSKITPKKIGQFLTVWHRNIFSITIPFDVSDQLDYLIILSEKDTKKGVFIFPKNTLVSKGIFSSQNKKGKLGFRLYPAWDKVESLQAEKTQHRQISYFYEITNKLQLKKLQEVLEITFS